MKRATTILTRTDCSTANPTLPRRTTFYVQPKKASYAAEVGVPTQSRKWQSYTCESCGGSIAAGVIIKSNNQRQIGGTVLPVRWIVPSVQALSNDIPAKAANYLRQARETPSSCRQPQSMQCTKSETIGTAASTAVFDRLSTTTFLPRIWPTGHTMSASTPTTNDMRMRRLMRRLSRRSAAWNSLTRSLIFYSCGRPG